MQSFTWLTFRGWSGGLVRRPWLFTLVTVIVCAGFAAHAASALVDARFLLTVSQRRPPPVPPMPPPPAMPACPDGGQLVARNMFCSSCVPDRSGALDRASIAAIAQATLIATGVGREPYATLVVPATARQGAWGVGDAIPGLGRLDRIAATWIEIVDGTGQRGRLSLLDPAADRDPGTAMPESRSAAPPWAERITRLDDQTYEVDRSLVRELVTGATRPGRVRPVPILDHGEIAGIRLFGVADDSIPAAVGLTTGDTLSAINGAPVKSLQQLFDLYATLDQRTSVELSGTHAGKPLVRTLRLR